jgi:hypothetical protein
LIGLARAASASAAASNESLGTVTGTNVATSAVVEEE